MEDYIQVIFYIIIAFLYLVSSLAGGKKKKKNIPQPKSRKAQPNQSTNPEASLEDLFKKMLQPQPQAEVQEPLKKLETPEPSSSFDAESSFFQEWQAEKEEMEREATSMDDVIQDIEKNIASSKKAIHTTSKEAPRKGNEYQKLFADKDSLKRAFIMSEIFNRKF